MNRGSAQQIGGSVGGAYDNTVAVKVELCYFHLELIIGFCPAIMFWIFSWIDNTF